MGLMTKEIELNVTSPLPAGLSRAAVVKALHDHHTVTRLNDDIKNKDKDIKLLSGNSAMLATYHVDDTKPGAGYDLQISNHNDGADTETLAYLPLGQKMKINSTWRVVQNGNGASLVEQAKVEGPRPIVAMVKGNIEGQHPGWHQKLFERARQLS